MGCQDTTASSCNSSLAWIARKAKLSFPNHFSLLGLYSQLPRTFRSLASSRLGRIVAITGAGTLSTYAFSRASNDSRSHATGCDMIHLLTMHGEKGGDAK